MKAYIFIKHEMNIQTLTIVDWVLCFIIPRAESEIVRTILTCLNYDNNATLRTSGQLDRHTLSIEELSFYD